MINIKRLILLTTLVLGIAGLLLFNRSLGVGATPPQREICYGECPTFDFHAERLVCPQGYDSHGQSCRKWSWERWNWIYADKVTENFDLVDIQRVKSQDPNKCHKPTPEDLDIPSWARDDYGKVEEWVLPNVIDCPRPTPTNCELLDRRLEDIEQFRKDCAENYPRCVSLLQECERNVCRILPDHPRCEQPTPTPTPEVTPTPTPEPVVHENLTPACPDHVVPPVPTNVYVERNGADATLYWTPQGGDLVNIYILTPEGVEVGAIGDTPNDGVEAVHELNPTGDYNFELEAHIGCNSGERVRIGVIDNYLPMVFNASYARLVR